MPNARAESRQDQRPKSDEGIHRTLLNELELRPYWLSDRSRVAVRDGIVHISGLFDSPHEAVATRVAAEKIAGVRGVEDTRTLSLAPGGYL